MFDFPSHYIDCLMKTQSLLYHSAVEFWILIGVKEFPITAALTIVQLQIAVYINALMLTCYLSYSYTFIQRDFYGGRST